MRKFLKRFLLVSMGCLVSVLLAEAIFYSVCLRPEVPENDDEFFVKMQTLDKTFPSSFEKGDTFRILGISDSFGRACGEGNFFFRLERLLRERGLRVEVVNISVAAYETGEELEILERFGLRFQPDLVLQGFFTGNDLHPRRGQLRTYRNISLVIDGWAPWRRSTWMIPQWWNRWNASRATNSATGPATGSEVSAALVDSGNAPSRQTGTLPPERFMEIVNNYRQHYRPSYKESREWLRVQDDLSRMLRLSRASGSLHVMVILPDQLYVERSLLDALPGDGEGSSLDFEQPRRLLARFAADHSMPVVDVSPDLSAAGNAGGCYLPLDSHLNDTGNQIVAVKIAEALASHIPRRAAVSSR